MGKLFLFLEEKNLFFSFHYLSDLFSFYEFNLIFELDVQNFHFIFPLSRYTIKKTYLAGDV